MARGAMGRDPKAGGGRASVGRDPMEMRRYQEAANRAQRLDPNSEAYANNKAILETTGAKYGLNWQKSLAQGYQPPQQQQQDQRPIQQTRYDFETGAGAPPQASANHGGQFRLSPGVYGTREQAQNQYDQGNSIQDRMLRLTPEQAAANRTWLAQNPNGFGPTGQQIPGGIAQPYQPYQPEQLGGPSANRGGQYRLSPGVYGSREQAQGELDQRNAAAEAGQKIGHYGQWEGQGQSGGNRIGQYYGGMGNMIGQGTEDLARTWNDKVGKPIGSVVSAPAKAYKKVFGW